jgi:putative ABC transport system permease protein
VFSVVYAVLLAPLPYEEPERLVRLSEIDPTGTDRRAVSIGTFVDWRARVRTLEAIAVYTIPGGGETLWSLDGRFEVVKISAVSPALFPLLHARPILGRTFSPDDPQGGGPSADRGKYVVSYGFWQRALGGAPDIIGRSVSVEGRFSAEIVGVMPRGFGFPQDVDAVSSSVGAPKLVPRAATCITAFSNPFGAWP